MPLAVPLVPRPSHSSLREAAIRCTREDIAESAQEQLEQAALEMLREEVPQLEGTLDRMQTWEHSGFDLYLGKVLEADNKPATQNLTEYILRPSFSLGAMARPMRDAGCWILDNGQATALDQQSGADAVKR